MADWATVSALVTGGGTLVLAVATFASVRSANRAARTAERSLLVGLRPVLMSSRLQDPSQKVMFVDQHWVHVGGGGAVAEVTDQAIDLAVSLRNAGNGLAVLHGWSLHTGLLTTDGHDDPDAFRRLTRDLYIAPGDIGFWQGAFRDPNAEEFAVARAAIEAGEGITVDLLYGDHEGGQRTITRFAPPAARQRRLDRFGGPALERRPGRSSVASVDLQKREGVYPKQTAEAFSARAVVLVEGVSDQLALEALAERRGRDLAGEGISVVPIGGAKNIVSFLVLFGPQGSDLRLAGLCDAAEEGDFRRGLERAGLGSNLTRDDMERLGFYVCVADLEDELIRSLGTASVEQIVDAQGELGSFRTLQKQPAQQGKTAQEQLRRFMGTRGGRKIQYAPLLIDALDLTQVPRPLDRVLAHV